MNHIYGSSAFTIAVTVGKGADAALPGLAPKSRSITQAAETICDLHLANRPWSFEKAVEMSTWNTRGWTFQERILSKRILFVTQQQLFFMCVHHPGYLSEDLDTKLKIRKPITHPMDGTGSDTIPQRWSTNILTYAKTVENFTARILSKDGDIENAFAGIAEKMKPLFRSDFIHCLPQSELDYCLLWRPCGKTFTRRLVGGAPTFPSWSWAGWVGQVDYPWRERLSRVEWVDEFNHCLTSDEYRAPHSSTSTKSTLEWRKEWIEQRTDEGFRYFYHSSNPNVWFRNPTALNSNRGPRCQPEGSNFLQIRAWTISLKFPKELKPQTKSNVKSEIAKIDLPVLQFDLRDENGCIMGYFQVPLETVPTIHHTKQYEMVLIARTNHSLSFDERKEARSMEENEIRPHLPRSLESNAEDTEIRSLHKPLEEYDDDADVTIEPTFFPKELSAEDAGRELVFDRQSYDAYKPFCLYEFLVVEWQENVAYRLGIGVIHIDAWAREKPTKNFIILG